MFLLSVLFMTAWMLCVVTGFAGGFAHLLGLCSIVTILMRRERCHLRPESKDANQLATV